MSPEDGLTLVRVGADGRGGGSTKVKLAASVAF
jgi:hypothetical protein